MHHKVFFLIENTLKKTSKICTIRQYQNNWFFIVVVVGNRKLQKKFNASLNPST